MMSSNKISGGYARVIQGLILLTFSPLVSMLSYGILTNDFTANGLAFLFAFITVIALVTWNAFSYSDVYLSNDFVLAKKLFATKHKKRSEVKQVTKALRPFTYRIKFVDGENVSFLSSISDTSKQLLSLDPDVTLTAIKSKMAKSANDKPI